MHGSVLSDPSRHGVATLDPPPHTPNSGRSIECRQCGYVGYPLERRLIPEFTHGLLNESYEIERTCPACGADDSHLAWRRGPVSDDARKIHEHAKVRADQQAMLRALRHALFTFVLIVVVIILFTLASQ